MANTSALIELKNIVEEFRLKSKLPQVEYANLKQLAIRGYQRLSWMILPQGRVVVKTVMNSGNMLAMPDDLVELNGVHIADQNGQLWTLSKNRKITPTVTDIGVFYGEDIPGVTPPDGEAITGIEDMVSEDTDDSLDGVIRDPDDPYYEGVDVPHPGGSGYQATGGVNLCGYYIEDFTNRRILFANAEQSEVVLDYLSTNIDDAGDTKVPIQALEAIHAYMAREYYSYLLTTPANRIALYDERLKREEQKLRNMRFNMNDFLDSVRRTMVGSIQR